MAEIPELKKGTALWQDMENAFTKCKLIAVSENVDLDAASILIGEMTNSLSALTDSLNTLTETNGTIDAITDRVDTLEVSTEDTSEIDAMLNSKNVSISGDTFLLDQDSKRNKNFDFESSDATAKTVTVSNIPSSASLILTTFIVKMTTACELTYPTGWSFVSAPTFSDGEWWNITGISLDGGTTTNAVAVRIK